MDPDKMNVLLVNTSMDEGYDKIQNLSGCAPPIGLAYIAAYLESKGISVQIVEDNAFGYTDDQLGVMFKTIEFDVVGVTAFTSNIKRAIHILEIAKSIRQCTAVVGGHHATALPLKTLSETAVDYVVKGEGEVTFAELVTALRNNLPVKDIRGVCYKDETGLHENPDRELVCNLDELPFPAHHLLPMSEYRVANHHAVGHGRKINLRPFFTIFTSRGCPFHCTFCASHIMWRGRVRYRSPESVIKELDFLVKEYGIKNVDVYDDTFTLDKARLHKILDLIIERNYGIDFSCLTRVDVVDDETLAKMRQAGFYNVRYGIESGSPEMLKLMRKGINLETAKKAIKIAQKHGLSVNAFFIFGHPGETKETAEQTIRFAIDSNPDFALFFTAIPLPGTDMSNMIKLQDVDYDNQSIVSSNASFNTDTLKKNEIAKIKQSALVRFYLRPSFIIRKILRLRSVEELGIYFRAWIAFAWLLVIKKKKPLKT